MKSLGCHKRISIIVLTYNKSDMLIKCLASIQKTLPDRDAPELLVVDNGSSDGTDTLVKQRFPWIRVVRIPKNIGYSRGMNIGIASSSPSSEYIVLLSNDLELHGDWIGSLIAPALKDLSVGIVGCKLVYPSGRIQHAGGKMDQKFRPTHIGQGELDRGDFDSVREMPFVTAAVMPGFT